jgi:type II secretory pathway component PulJ
MALRAERGIALLEVLVALTLLAWGGVSLLAVLAALTSDLHRRRMVERQIEAADRVLAAAALLDRRDLDRRIGTQPVGGLLLRVQRPEPNLYRLSVADTLSAEVDLLATVVFRRVETPDD